MQEATASSESMSRTLRYGARVVTDDEGLDYGGWGQVQGEQLGVQAE